MVERVGTSLFRLNTLPSCGRTTFRSSTRSSVDTRVLSAFWPLWIALLWTFLDAYLFERLFSIHLGLYPSGPAESEGDHMFNVRRNCPTVSTAAGPCYVSASNAPRPTCYFPRLWLQSPQRVWCSSFLWCWCALPKWLMVSSISLMLVGHWYAFVGETVSSCIPLP